MSSASSIQFTTVGTAKVAFQTHGEGDLDIVYCPGLASHLDLTMEQPRYRRYVDGLCEYGRVIRFDRRGSGVSDPLPPDATDGWDLWADDLSSVLSAAGSTNVVIVATNDAGPAGMLYAASNPDRMAGLVLFNTTARFLAADDYPQGHPPEVAGLVTDVLRSTWGTEDSVAYLTPSLAADEPFRRWYSRFQRGACSPAEMADSLARIFRMDARHVLGEIRCPTLVLHREGYTTAPIAQGQYLADHIPGAVFEALPGADATIYTESTEDILTVIGRFLGRQRSAATTDHRFGTVLFTDIVDSTARASSLGDDVWHRLLDDHDARARDVVDRHEGRLIKTTGDGLLATFDSPMRAVRAARSLIAESSVIGLEIRAALHAGQIVQRLDGDIAGVAVHIAARVLGIAGPSETLLTGAVRDLLVEEAILSEDRGEHRFKGVDAPHRVHALISDPQG